MARGRLTHWSKINGEVAGRHFKQLLHKGTCGERTVLAETPSRGGTAARPAPVRGWLYSS